MNTFLKFLKYLYKILKVLIYIVLILIIFIILIQRIFNNKISVGGYRIFTVVTPSMEPEYKVYDVIISKSEKPQNLKIGDDIVYLGNSGDFNNKIITHRIIDIVNEQNTYTITTQGIANSAPDPEITNSQVYGKVIYKSTILSFLSKILNNSVGFYFLILVPLAFLIMAEIFDRIKEKNEEE